MTDIVATIQAEQDRIIRTDLAGALVVQGGPGTGKTAVATVIAGNCEGTRSRAATAFAIALAMRRSPLSWATCGSSTRCVTTPGIITLHFRTVAGIEDEVLDVHSAHVNTASEQGTLTGEGALLASLGSRRTGKMTDICVTTPGISSPIVRLTTPVSPREGSTWSM